MDGCRSERPAAQLTTPSMRTFIYIALVLMACLSTAHGEATGWPAFQVPPDASTFDVGAEVTLNGLPTRMIGFFSAVPPDKLTDWYRKDTHGEWVQDAVGQTRILGRAEEHYYLTVQLTPVPGGTRGVVSVASFQSARSKQQRAQDTARWWLNRLPADTKVVSQIESEDGGQSSLYMLMVNRNALQTNIDYVKQAMSDDGLQPFKAKEREQAAKDSGPDGASKSAVLYFKGPGKDAVAVVTRAGDGWTGVVINRVSKLSTFSEVR